MKKFRSVWMALIIMILSIAVVIGSIGVSAFAATVVPSTNNIFNTNQKLAEKVEYGSEFTVPDADGVSGSVIKVTAPNGQPATINTNKVTATQVGNYIVDYMSGAGDDAKVLYSFSVYSYLEKDYFIKVDGNGAGVPTYIETGKKFTVPNAVLAYYDDKENLQTVDAQDIDISIGGDAVNAGDEYEVTNAGTIYVRYSAKLEGGSKVYSKEFIIKAQNSFIDEAAPVLNTVNIPTTGNINKKVTLPIATATDNFDTNIRYDIKVTFKGQDVLEYEIDENGFANPDKPIKKNGEDVKVQFDNDKQMYFYPTVADPESSYVITYTAYDDQGNASGTHSQNLICSDKAAPEFKEINDFTIPSKWSVNAGVIKFPNPTVVDNSLSDKISVSFKITDTTSSTSGSSNKVTIVEFSNIKGAAGESGTISKIDKYNDNTQVTFDASNDYFEFDFSKYADAKEGDYAIEYKVTDGNKNNATKTYKINIDSTFDSAYGAPNTNELETVKYFALGKDENFIVPTPNVKDKQDSNLEVDYRIISDVMSDNSKYLSVKGGEKINIVKIDNKYYLQLDDKTYTDTDKGLELNTNLYFYVEATNDIGKTIANTSDKAVKGNNNTYSNIVKVLNTESVTNNFTLTLDYSTVTNSAYKINATNLTEPDLTALTEAEKVINAGGFIISGINEDYRKYTGFEVAVYDKNNKALDNVTLETFTTLPDNGTCSIYVRNIEFMPSVAGDYRLVISAFDVAGKSSIKSISFKVVGSVGGSVDATSISFPGDNKGSINTTYTLPNEKVEVNNPAPGVTYLLTRKIKGGKFSIMGNEFTAKTQTKYTINDGYIDQEATKDAVSGTVVTTEAKYSNTNHLSAASSEKIVIETHDVLPQYVEKNATVLLPYITGANKNGNAEVVIKVFNKNGEVTLNKIADDDYIKTDADGKVSIVKESTGNVKANTSYGYYFKTIADGDYSIKVTASLGEQTDEKEFIIKSGDIINPVIKVENAPSTRYKIGEKFSFSKVTSENKATGVEATLFTYTKQLVDVNGNEVASVSGSGTKYQDMLDNNGDDIILDKSGTYTVIYKVKDTVDNETILKYEFTVKADSSGISTSLTALSTVLIIVGVLLLAGLIIYLVRFRKVKK